MQKVLGPRLQSRQLPPLTDLKPEFEDLCAWIDAQIDKPLGWQELMQRSGLDHQTIKALFFKFASTTPMTWIRQRRETRVETRAAAPRYAVPATRALQHQAA